MNDMTLLWFVVIELITMVVILGFFTYYVADTNYYCFHVSSQQLYQCREERGIGFLNPQPYVSPFHGDGS